MSTQSKNPEGSSQDSKNTISYWKNLGKANLSYLSKELAVNYFNASTSKVFDSGSDATIRSKIFKQSIAWSQDDRVGDLLNPQLGEPSFCVRKFDDIGIGDSWSKNILVLGAGASYDTFGDLYLGGEAIDYIHNRIEIPLPEPNKPDRVITFKELIELYKPGLDQERTTLKKIIEGTPWHNIAQKYHKEKDRLRLYGPELPNDQNSIDFETSLLLLTRFFPVSWVRSEVQKIYDARYGPTRFYELVSHMLKHRVIDIIINFNFDELLDQALHDELGEGNYHMVLSDGDCTELNELLNEERIKVPIYIKPHGTASHKSTLRFTKDHYYELPYDMRKFLEGIFSTKGTKADRVNLIVVGFNMESIEFNEILRTRLPARSNVFMYQRSNSAEGILRKEKFFKKKFDAVFKTKTNPNDPEKEKVYKENTPGLYLIPFRVLNDGETNKFLGGAFSMLNEEISSHFKDGYQPPGVDRHEIISLLFGSPEAQDCFRNKEEKAKCLKKGPPVRPKAYFDSAQYFRDRTIVEMYIALAKRRGILDPEELLNEKTGIYYSLYFKNDTKKSKVSLYQLLESLEDGGPVTEKNNKMGPKFYKALSTVEDWFPEDLSSANKRTVNPFKEKSKIDEYFSIPFRNYLKTISSDKQKLSLLRGAFRKLFEESRSVVKANFKDPQRHMFQNFAMNKVLNTRLAIGYYIHDIMRRCPNFNVVFSVAETGSTLKTYWKDILEKSPECRFFIILAYPGLSHKGDKKKKEDYERKAEEFLNDKAFDGFPKDQMKILFLPPRKHNHHMQIFLKTTDTKIVTEESAAIYYQQRGYSQHINPFLIDHSDNLELLLQQFKNYREDAHKYSVQKNYVDKFASGLDFSKENNAWVLG